MKIYFARAISPSGLIVARNQDPSIARNKESWEPDFELVWEIDIPKVNGPVSATDPRLQNLLRESFVDGVEWARKNPSLNQHYKGQALPQKAYTAGVDWARENPNKPVAK